MKIENMFSSFKNSTGETVGYIDIFGAIGEGWGENGARDFIKEFRELEKSCSKIIINISSEGGSVFCGQQVASYIKQSKIKTIANIGSLCASIATVIASACDIVIMPNNALWMTHSPISKIEGNAHDMRERADLLDKIEETILNIYVDKCKNKCSREQIKQLVQGKGNNGQGTFMYAQECFDCGFVDEVGHELAIAAKLDDPSNAIINGIKMDLSGYQNLDRVREIFENKTSCKNNIDIKNDIGETNMSEEQKVSATIIDQIANAIKNVIGIKDEVEPEVEQPQEEPVAEGEVQEEQEPEVVEEPQQEEPENVEEPSTEELEEEELETESEIEPSVDVEDSIVPKVEASVDLAAQVQALTKQLEEIKNADAQKAIKLAKAELSKEVEAKFEGVPGKLEDKVDKIYSIKNSNLEESEKEFILNGLSLLSSLNLKACEEEGINDTTSEYLDDKERKLAESKALAKKEGISEGKALHILDGTMTLEQAKKSKK